jgi:hypothetical protein
VSGKDDKRKSPLLEKAAAVFNQQVGGDFSRVESMEKKEALLRSSVHSRHPNVLWTKDRQLLKRFFVRNYSEHLGVLECEFAGRASRVLEEVDQELDRVGKNEVYFNIRCQESTLFFRLYRREISSRSGMLSVKVPKDLFEIQRRSQLRYRVVEGDGFHLATPLLGLGAEDRRILDISAGGVGVQVRFPSLEARSEFKPPFEEKEKLILDLEGLTFQLEAEIRYMKPLDDEWDGSPALRIGLKFIGVRSEVSESLQLFVMDRSYDRLKSVFGEG